MRALVLCYGNWYGPVRLPRALKRVGFEVGMVCRPDNMATKTRFVDQFFLGAPNSDLEIIRDLVTAIEAFGPDVIIPGLEPAVIALLQIWHLHSEGKLPMLSQASAQAVRRSLFDPHQEKFFYSKIDLIDAMAQRGVRVPAQRELHTFGDADIFVQEHGYPVLLKPDRGYAGSGIVFCHDEEKLLEELPSRLQSGTRQRWCVQKAISGPTAMLQYCASEGRVQIAYSLLRLVTNPAPTGPCTVVELFENKEMEAAGVQLADLLSYNGLGSAQFVLAEDGSGAYMFEANMRIGVSMHLGEVFGPDLCRALMQQLSGIGIVQSAARLGVRVALYPQEALRDPGSEYLKGQVDRPSDDPALLNHFEEMLRSA